jgi:hypothetical protein
MNSINISLVVLTMVFGGAMLGMVLSRRLPDHHLTPDSVAHVKVGASLLTSMIALLLSLQLSSGKSAFDLKERELSVMASKLVMLDRTLAHYGPAATDARAMLRSDAVSVLNQGWPQERLQAPSLKPTTGGGEPLYDKIQELTPENDSQRLAKAQALSIVIDLGEMRWLNASTIRSSTSIPLMIVEIAWATIAFFSFGIFAPRNLMVVANLFLCACAVAAGFFLIVEMTTPYGGLIRASSAPLREALAGLGQ